MDLTEIIALLLLGTLAALAAISRRENPPFRSWLAGPPRSAGAIGLPASRMSTVDLVESALDAYRQGKAELPDYLILGKARAAGVHLLTFDRQLSRKPGARLLPTREPRNSLIQTLEHEGMCRKNGAPNAGGRPHTDKLLKRDVCSSERAPRYTWSTTRMASPSRPDHGAVTAIT
jgi:hypothetical protein